MSEQQTLVERLRTTRWRPGYTERLPPDPLCVEAAAEIERLRKELRELDPDPVVCGCREALCPHTPVARLPRQELVNHFKQRLKDSAAEIERLTDNFKRVEGMLYATEDENKRLRGGEGQ